MNDDLAAYLGSIDGKLVRYLDEQKELSVATVAHLHRYAVALVQRLIVPAQVEEDWRDFFELAEAFVLAYGSKRLGLLNRRARLLDTRAKPAGEPVGGPDRLFLMHFVDELGRHVSQSQRSDDGGGATRH